MDTESGRLVREDLLKRLDELEQKKFTPVPAKLEEEAEAALGDQAETVIDLKISSPLSDWANKYNRKARSRKANKRAKASQEGEPEMTDQIICNRCALEPWEGKVLASIKHAIAVQRKGASVTVRIPPDLVDPNQDLKVKESINR